MQSKEEKRLLGIKKAMQSGAESRACFTLMDVSVERVPYADRSWVRLVVGMEEGNRAETANCLSLAPGEVAKVGDVGCRPT